MNMRVNKHFQTENRVEVDSSSDSDCKLRRANGLIQFENRKITGRNKETDRHRVNRRELKSGCDLI